jgi:UPF0755 protein
MVVAQTDPNRVQGRRRRIVKWVTGVFAVGVIGVLALIGWFYEAYQPPTAKQGQATVLTVQSGQTVTAIGESLAKAGLIRNAFVFRLYVSYHHLGRSFQAGRYQFKVGMSIAQLTQLLAHGKVMSNAVKVTIPEGFTVKQIAERLAANHICTQQSFLSQVQDGQFTEPFLKQIVTNKNVKFRLEGYLFPDTYDIRRGESPHQVVDAMLKDFQRHFNTTVMAQIKASGQTLEAVVTKASLVVEEAKVSSERPIIASVIDNRLKDHMKLEIDATIEYILGHQNIVTYKDLKVQDPYNTYLHAGLPPGPIASPGMASIEAAIHPAHTGYLYYVAKYNGTGEHYFSKTYAQQLHNEQLSAANRKKQSH